MCYKIENGFIALGVPDVDVVESYWYHDFDVQTQKKYVRDSNNNIIIILLLIIIFLCSLLPLSGFLIIA